MSDTENSFIANVNTLADNYEVLERAIEVPTQLEQIKNETEEIKTQTEHIYNDTNTLYVTTRQLYNATNELKDQVTDTYNEAENILRQVNETALNVDNKIAAYEDSVKMTDGITNSELIMTTTTVIPANTILDFDEFSYYVGRNTLFIAANGRLLTRDIDYKEIGEDGTLSHQVKFINSLDESTVVTFVSIASNLTNLTQETYDNAVALKKEIDTTANVIRDNLVESTELTDRANSAMMNSIRIYNKLSAMLREYQSDNLPLLSFKDDSHTYIPGTDCYFIYNIDLESREDSPTNNTPVTQSMLTICGRRLLAEV